MASKPSPRLESTVVQEPQMPSSSGMSLEQLRHNYRELLRAKAIFYPVSYQFLRALGSGRQGVVYLGLRQGARGCITEHAIKIFDPGLYHTPEEYWTDMGRIASQISRLQRMQSPHLVSRHAYDETYGIGYTQMEAIDGIDLRRFLTMPHMKLAKRNSTSEEWKQFSETVFVLGEKRAYLRPELVLYILRGVLRGLERLHEMNFLHSDVKPGNIMIDRLGSVKIVDFGRAVLTGERLSFLLGSPLYMAPETHRREAGTMQSDLYSLGLVMLELLSGERVSEEEDISEADLLQLKIELPDNIKEILPKHVRRKKHIVSMLRKLLDPEPENRFESAREVDTGPDGLKIMDAQFARQGLNTELARELSDYISKLVDARTDRVEVNHDDDEESSERKDM